MATPTPADLLVDAQAALHALLTGKQVVTVKDSNGEQVTYSIASADRLQAYVQNLKDQTTGGRQITGPMRLWG